MSISADNIRANLDSAGFFRVRTTNDIVEVFVRHSDHVFWALSLLTGAIYRPLYEDVDHGSELTPLEVLAYAAHMGIEGREVSQHDRIPCEEA